MRKSKNEFVRRTARKLVSAARLGCFCLFAASLALAQTSIPPQEHERTSRPLTEKEGRAIAIAAREHEPEVRGKPDCSHLVHTIYRLAGFEYPFANSQDLYAGADSFERVKTPQAGDLITWPGHVGIVLDTVRHTFYSSVRSWMRAEFYDGPYWKARGKPRFYRYVTARPPEMVLAKSKGTRSVVASASGHAVAEDAENVTVPIGPKPLTKEDATKPEEDMPSSDDAMSASKTEIPGSILIAAGFKKPTTDQVSDGISKLSEEAANVLRGDEPLRPRIPVCPWTGFMFRGTSR